VTLLYRLPVINGVYDLYWGQAFTWRSQARGSHAQQLDGPLLSPPIEELGYVKPLCTKHGAIPGSSCHGWARRSCRFWARRHKRATAPSFLDQKKRDTGNRSRRKKSIQPPSQGWGRQKGSGSPFKLANSA